MIRHCLLPLNQKNSSKKPEKDLPKEVLHDGGKYEMSEPGTQTHHGTRKRSKPPRKLPLDAHT